MTIQDYLMVDKTKNVVINNVLWDGNTDTWTPPSDVIMLAKDSTGAMVWLIGPDKKNFVLTNVIGSGNIGFTWNGSVLTTNAPQPDSLQDQPITGGTQNI